MAQWTDLQAGLSGGDETVAFGPRLEAGTALYQVETLASIGPAGSSPATIPSFLAASTPESFCISVDTSVHVLDGRCCDAKMSVTLPAPAEVIAWTPEAHHLAIADSMGSLHFFDAQNQCLLFSQELARPLPQQQRLFASVEFVDSSTLMVLTTSGKLFRFANVDLASFGQAFASKDMATLKQLKDRMVMSQFDVSAPHKESVLGALSTSLRGTPAFVVWGHGRAAISVWTEADGVLIEQDAVMRPFGERFVKKCTLAPGGERLLVLDSGATISQWHFPSFVRVCTSPESLIVDEFHLLKGTSQRADSDEAIVPQLAVMTRDAADTSRTKRFFRILSADTFHEEYSLQVSPLATIATGAEFDTLYLVEGRKSDAQHQAEIVIEESLGTLRLFVRCLTETLPTNRFYHLLHKHRFDEAMMFANQFGLDKDLVYRVRTTSILDRADRTVEPSIAVELRQTLDSISDLEFVVDSCLQACLPSVGETLSVLEYALDRLQTAGQEASLVWKCRILGTIKRLGTFQLAAKDVFDVEGWHRFRDVDLVREVMTCWSQGRVSTAVIIWDRHLHEYDLIAHVASVLSSIPEDTQSDAILPWLSSVCSSAIRQQHAAILRWTANRARLLELTEKAAWPRNALNLIDATASLCSLYGTNAPQLWPSETATPAELADRLCGEEDDDDDNTDASCAEDTQELMRLRSALEDMFYLREELNFTISLSDYLQETPVSIAALLLERVSAAELVPDVVNSEVDPYLQRHRITGDGHLLRYLTDLVGVATGVCASTCGSAWEAKVIAVVYSIRDTATRVQATLEVMRRVAVPYSQQVEDLIRDALGWRHGRVDELREQYRIMQLKHMMLNYGIRDFNLTDVSLARGLMRHILSRLDIATAMDDALQVVNAYHHLEAREAYVERLQNLFLADRTADALALLESLPHVIKTQAGEEIMQWTLDMTCDPVLDEADKQSRLGIYGAALECADVVLQSAKAEGLHHEDAAEELRESCKMLKNLLLLLKRHGVIASAMQLQSRTQSEELLLSAAIERLPVYETDSSTIAPLDSALTQQLSDIAALLGFDQHELVSVLAAGVDHRLPFAQLAVRVQLVAALCQDLQQWGDSPKLARSMRLAADAIARFLGQEEHVPLVLQSAKQGGVAGVTATAATTTATANATATMTTATTASTAITVATATSTPATMAAVPTPLVLGEIAARIVSACSEFELCDSVELFRGCELAAHVFEACDTGIMDASALQQSGTSFFGEQSAERREEMLRSEAAERNATHDLKGACANRFREDGLVLEYAAIGPLAGRFALAALEKKAGSSSAARAKSPAFHYRHERQAGIRFESPEWMLGISKCARDVVERLAERRLLQLALRYGLAATNACAQQTFLHGDFGDGLPLFMEIQPRACSSAHELCSGLLTKTLNAVYLDRRMAMGLMAVLPLEGAFKTFRASISQAKRNFRRISELAILGVGFSWLWQQQEFLEECNTLSKNAEWWHRLTAIGVAFDRKRYEQDTQAYTLKLVPLLLAKSGFDLALALEFADTYKLSRDAVVTEYIRLLLVSHTELDAKDPEADTAFSSFHSKLLSATECVADPAALAVLIRDQCLFQVSPYHYARLQFVMNMLNHIATICPEPPSFQTFVQKGLLLLGVLRHYKRALAPSSYELGFCEERVGSLDTLDAANLRLTRLPFHQLVIGDPWKILRAELSLNTVAKLLPVARLLNLSPDDFHVVVVEKLMDDQAKASTTTDSLQAVDFEQMRPILERIANPEVAIMTAKMVADGLPLGEGKINALRTAHAMTRRWQDNLEGTIEDPVQQEKVLKMMERLSSLYKRIATENDLTLAGMQKLAPLVRGEPAELISSIYEQYTLARSRTSREQVELHQLADNIAERYGLDAEKLRRFLIQKWLLSAEEAQLDIISGSNGSNGSSGVSAAPSLSAKTLSLGAVLDDGAPEAVETPNSKEFDLNLQRAICLLRQGTDKEETVAYLLNFAYMENSLKITPRARLRAFSALFSIAPTTVICDVAQQSLAELREHLMSLVYVAKLEAAHVHLTPSEFSASSKEGLAGGLWRDHKQKPFVVRIIAELCLDYQIHDGDLWSSLLQQLLVDGNPGYLAHVLVAVAGVPRLWYMPDLAKIWHSVLCTPFRLDEIEVQEESFVSGAVKLLLRSPFVLKTDPLYFAKQWAARSQPAAAAVCVAMHHHRSEQADFMKQLVAQLGLVEMFDALRKAQSPLNSKIRVMLYQLVDSEKRYKDLMPTKHFDGLVKYLVSMDAVEGLFSQCIEMKQFPNAGRLMRFYVRAHPTSEVARESLLCDNEPTALALAYARNKGLGRAESILLEAFPELLPTSDDHDESMTGMPTNESRCESQLSSTPLGNRSANALNAMRSPGTGSHKVPLDAAPDIVEAEMENSPFAE
eukprot:m.307220 g.307220  ORF g.307220 m.307220 type:complete len:2402 (-) comp19836_c0_seq1:32-7237(-)